MLGALGLLGGLPVCPCPLETLVDDDGGLLLGDPGLLESLLRDL